jgi:hypothetical protein
MREGGGWRIWGGGEVAGVKVERHRSGRERPKV